MSIRARAAAFILVAACVIAVALSQRDALTGISLRFAQEEASAATPKPAARSSETVLAIAPGVKRAAPTQAAASNRVTALYKEYRDSRDHRPIYDRLKASTTRTAEENFVLADILERCAKITDRKKQPWEGKWKLGGEDAKARFADSLSPKAPNREKRIAAFEEINYDACANFADVETTQAQIRALLDASAASGDPKARALVIRKDIESQRRGPDGEIDWTKPASITDAQLEAIRQVVASGDPRALQDGLGLLNGQYANFHLRSPDEAPLNGMAFWLAGDLLACDLGKDCGPTSRNVMQGCAFQGHCDAADYRDYLLYYASAPGNSQLVVEYQARLSQAIRSGDWSWFQFHRGPSPSYAAFQRP